MDHDLTLTGHGIELRPLRAHDAPALLALVDAAAWQGFTSPVPQDEDAVRDWIHASVTAPGKVVFAVVGQDDRQFRGTTSFYDLVPDQGRVEIGGTLYGRSWWGGPTNPAAKLLLLTQAFDVWGLARVALRADSRNARSLAAIGRLGAVREGVLRSHRVAGDGTRGDTVYFSVLADEWPAVRAGLEARLAPA
ncbi:GNAT family N-acetyltransferase [Luteimicrobium sp. NPDC057192]|uniref:GNAT family N-acetyltransferase n=1 Tax=Luteimicrobium sp. NPDC057192 TaxID=3346042 RepID=UPI0036314AF4